MKKTVVIKRHRMKTRQETSQIRYFKLGSGLPAPQEIRDELQDMREVLLGNDETPIDNGIMTLMEVAEAYFSRACDIEQQILRAQEEGRIVGGNTKTNPYHTLRTQELRSFKEMAKSATELGSRRITAASLLAEQERRGRESV